MTSAIVPAFCSRGASRAGGSAAYLVALLSVCVPWMVFTSFLLTEVAAYPAFLWAILAVQCATVKPRMRNDVLRAARDRPRDARADAVLRARARARACDRPRGARVRGRSEPDRRGPCSAAGAPSRGHRLLGVSSTRSLTRRVVVLLAAGQLSSAVGTYARGGAGQPVPARTSSRRSPSISPTIALGARRSFRSSSARPGSSPGSPRPATRERARVRGASGR